MGIGGIYKYFKKPEPEKKSEEKQEVKDKVIFLSEEDAAVPSKVKVFKVYFMENGTYLMFSYLLYIR